MKRTPAAGPPVAFWRDRRGLDLVHVALLPGRTELDVRFRFGQAYRVPVECLGLGQPALLAALGDDPRVVVLALRDGTMVDLPATAILALAEPAFAAKLTEKAPTIGAKVRALRLASGRKASAVAEAAGMARSNYARLEMGRHEPRLATLRRVAEALGQPLEALL